MAIDVPTGSVEVLDEAAPFPADFPSSVAWDDGVPALYQSGDDLCATLFVLQPRPAPLDASVTIGSHTFALGVDVGNTTGRCPDDGRAGRPAVHGGQTAFVASAAAGATGQDLIDRSWDLFTSSGTNAPRRVLGGVYHPGDQLWSADGRNLFTVATIGARAGAWRINVETGNATLLVAGDFTRLSLSPSEDRLVAVNPGEPATLVVVDLPR